MIATVEINAWLRGEGFASPTAAAAARSVLEDAGLTNPRKRAMVASKVEPARALLAARLQRVCGAGRCRETARQSAAGRSQVEVPPASCEICGGSNNAAAAREMAAACVRAGVTRLLIVGGTRVLHAELKSLLAGSGVSLRCIDGAETTPSKKEALSDLAWADLMVIWASSPLPHKVSVSYTDECPPSVAKVTVRRRGIEALCGEVTASVSGAAAARRRA
ncbi:MAG: hypothetical protein HY875_14570 [Chloroflexi bacterium]|nr:hypothetical protein [Chloroflexota bacterium]